MSKFEYLNPANLGIQEFWNFGIKGLGDCYLLGFRICEFLNSIIPQFVSCFGFRIYLPRAIWLKSPIYTTLRLHLWV